MRCCRSLQRNSSRMKKNSITAEEMRDAYNKHSRRKMSDPDIHHNLQNETISSTTPRSQAITIPPGHLPGSNIPPVLSPVASPQSGNSEGMYLNDFLFSKTNEDFCSYKVSCVVDRTHRRGDVFSVPCCGRIRRFTSSLLGGNSLAAWASSNQSV